MYAEAGSPKAESLLLVRNIDEDFTPGPEEIMFRLGEEIIIRLELSGVNRDCPVHIIWLAPGDHFGLAQEALIPSAAGPHQALHLKLRMGHPAPTGTYRLRAVAGGRSGAGKTLILSQPIWK